MSEFLAMGRLFNQLSRQGSLGPLGQAAEPSPIKDGLAALLCSNYTRSNRRCSCANRCWTVC